MRSGYLFVVAASLLAGGAWGDMLRNPPCKLDEGQNSASTCEKCPEDGASNGCVHIQINLGRTYTANALNQCTAIDDVVPTFGVDGNQTTALTETAMRKTPLSPRFQVLCLCQYATLGLDLGMRVCPRIFSERNTHGGQTYYCRPVSCLVGLDGRNHIFSI